MDRVAERLLCGDAVERAMWEAVFARAVVLADEREVLRARLIARALVGG